MHDEQCTCGNHIRDEDIPPGKVMMIANEENGPLCRSKILFHDFSNGSPEEHEPEVLYQTGWHRSRRKADADALYRYWPLYEFRHGFKHPEDPRRTADDKDPEGFTVLTTNRPEL